MSETHEKIMSMVHELEEEYGTLSATPLDSDKLKQLQDYTKSLPNERGGGYIPRQYTIDDIQKALDTGEKIVREFSLSKTLKMMHWLSVISISCRILTWSKMSSK